MPKRGESSTEGKRSGGSLANVTHSPKNIAFPAMPADLLDRTKKTTPEPMMLEIFGAMMDQHYRRWPMS